MPGLTTPADGVAGGLDWELTLAQMLGSAVHRQLLIAGAVAMGNPALCGHVAFQQYATQFFNHVGFDVATGSSLAIVLWGVKLLTTIPDFLWLDAIDRRQMMSIGLAGVGGSYVLAEVAAWAGCREAAAAALLLGAGVYQASVAPLSWIVPAEAFPADMRNRGASVASALFGLSAMLVVQTYPILGRGGHLCFLSVYAGTTCVAFVINRAFLPETRGRTLEQISDDALNRRLMRRPSMVYWTGEPLTTTPAREGDS